MSYCTWLPKRRRGNSTLRRCESKPCSAATGASPRRKEMKINRFFWHRCMHSWHHAPRDGSSYAEREVNCNRRGGVLVAVLVVMTVASLLFAAMLRTNRQEILLLRSHQ